MNRFNEEMGFELALENVQLKRRTFLNARKTYREE